MARITVSNSTHESTTTSESHSKSQSQSQSQSQSSTKKVLDEKLRDQILSGLMGYMTDEEIDAYAENLLRPQRDAQLEAARQKYETERLLGEQEIENLAADGVVEVMLLGQNVNSYGRKLQEAVDFPRLLQKSWKRYTKSSRPLPA